MKRLFSLFLAVFLITCCIFPITVSAEESEMTALERRAEIYRYLTEEMFFPASSACGILANIAYETAFTYDPTIQGDYDESKEEYTSYGLCQWHNERWDNLKAFCKETGLDHTTIEGQLEFFYEEIYNNYHALSYSWYLNEEDNVQHAYNTAYQMCTQFERPANMYQRAEERGVYAVETLMVEFLDLDPDTLIYEHFVTDVSYDYNSGLSASQETDVGTSLNNALTFIKDIPSWFNWLPGIYLTQFVLHFDLVFKIACLLIVLKVVHG